MIIKQSLKKNISGFTLVEVLVSIVIASIAVSSLAFAIAKGVKHTESIRLKNAAYLELKEWTEEWRANIASGYTPIGGSSGTFCNDTWLDVKILSENGENLESVIAQHENSTRAKLCREVTTVQGLTNYSNYYNIKTWIEWEDNFRGLNSDSNREKLEFEVNQIAIVN